MLLKECGAEEGGQGGSGSSGWGNLEGFGWDGMIRWGFGEGC